ncbi:RNase adapter RapZ [Curtanaerobium respiraculi]|uniref:RNase adapter RapZ n=1 Tax=Curtanaerobium respiraculi TaxID=2949669 RepID=UPI0024B34E94|nr:RNase adapter RapZ [Curtanaerobium respiraculi]
MAESTPELVVITGMSGAGRTEAMRTFEDMGYFCIDNLPPSLLKSLVTSESIPTDKEGGRRLAVVCDARNKNYLRELTHELARLQEAGIDYRIIFLDAIDSVILGRYKASRRRHPLNIDGRATITQSINQERELLHDLRLRADCIIDTSSLRPIELRRRVADLFAEGTRKQGMEVVVYSFGFKHAPASDADIVIDVRFLPNPYYDPQMRHLTGLDGTVRDFVLGRPETKAFLEKWEALLECVMPGYVAEGKSQLCIAVGCTGGQHRSVALAEATGAFLKESGYSVHVSHRDLPRVGADASRSGEAGQ